MDAQLGTSSKLTFPGAMSQQDADASSFKREGFRSGSSLTDLSSNASSSINYRKARQDKFGGDGFWCGVLCMHLPGLSRRRPMRQIQQQQSMSLSEADTGRASTATGPAAGDHRSSTVPKAASMERFKYSSSSSSGIVFGERTGAGEEEEELSAYFDLPLELLRISSVDTESPVTAAFLFDGNNRGRSGKKIVPEIADLEFSFPVPPVFSNHSSSPSS